MKKTLKQILSLPITTADPAPYILSGILPAEAFIHQRALTFFGNICRLSNTCIEKRLAIRQCSLKSVDSHSWFSSIKKLLIQYDLPQMDILLYEMPSKYVWSRKVKEGIYTHWRNRILCDADLYSSLQYMDTTMYVQTWNLTSNSGYRLPVISRCYTACSQVENDNWDLLTTK